MRTSSRSPSAGQCVPDNGKMLDMLLYSSPLYRFDTGTLHCEYKEQISCLKGFSGRISSYMTGYHHFYSGEERLSDRRGATGMLEKAEPRDRVYTGEVCQDEIVSFNVIECV